MPVKSKNSQKFNETNFKMVVLYLVPFTFYTGETD